MPTAPPTVCLGPHRSLAAGQPALVVAELGQNHNGRPELAEALVDAAAWAGADAVKVVKRDLEWELAVEARQRPYRGPHAYGPTYEAHRRALELAPAVHARLAERARRHRMLFVATACDPPSAEALRAIGVDAFKIASRDLDNLPLLAHVAAYGLPVFASTGMSTFAEIDLAVEVLRQRQCPHVLLQCTSLYPTPIDQVHLRSMAALAERYGVLVGYSDHSAGILLPPVAVALGAVVIEKHLTLDCNARGTDHACSLEPEAFRRMVENLRAVEAALGRADKPLAQGVAEVRGKLGRSLVARMPLEAGTRIEEHMLALRSPGVGISWLARDRLLGRRLLRPVAAGHLLSLDDVR